MVTGTAESKMEPSTGDSHRKPAILLLAFKFPPYKGVGGNRWANLVNEFARFGCIVHVVSVKWKKEKGAPWSDATFEELVQIHRIRSGSFHNLFHRRFHSGALEYLRKLTFSRHLLRKIWWDDEAQYWGCHLLKYCTRLSTKVHFDVIIATGHPFEANYWASLLAKKTGLPLIQDLRDPWIDNPYAKYNARQRRVVAPRVRAVLENCDRVVAVTRGLLDVYSRHVDLSRKGVVIQNGHSMLPLSTASRDTPDTTRRVPTHPRFVYLGNISNGREEPFEWLLRAIDAGRRTGDASSRVEVYCMQGEAIERRFQQYVQSGILVFHAPVAHSEIPSILRVYDAAIHLTARLFPYAASTKIYEYAAAGIPTLSINYGGEAEQLLRDLDCGVSINLNTENGIRALERAIEAMNHPFTYRVESFQWSALARRYLNLVDEVLASRTATGAS